MEENANLNSPPALETSGLRRSFGAVTALDSANLVVHQGEFFSLLGPSGCGKTTLLRLVAGLDHPDSGEIRIHGADMTPVPANERPVNTVFQSYALFPHLTVEQNVSFGLRMKRTPAAETARRVSRMCELMEIADLRQRKPHQLSGGQKQRVALARAIVNEPKLLLLDEPLAAVDARLRKQLQEELRRFQRQIGMTFLHVTHDQEEALAVSDRIAVMNRGKIEQIGSPPEIYETPATRFVAEFVGTCNLIRGVVASRAPTRLVLQTAFGDLLAEAPENAAPNSGQARLFAIRPERLAIGAPPQTGNTFEARILERTYTGAESHYLCQAGSETLKVSEPNSAETAGPRRVGDIVRLTLPPSALKPLADE